MNEPRPETIAVVALNCDKCGKPMPMFRHEYKHGNYKLCHSCGTNYMAMYNQIMSAEEIKRRERDDILDWDGYGVVC